VIPRSLAELQARAPAKRKKTELFAPVPLAAAARAFAAMRCPKAMVYVWLIHQARLTGKRTVALPNAALSKYRVGREVKRLALRQLEQAGFVVIERRSRKTPIVTLL
jgi:hypothetical protein